MINKVIEIVKDAGRFTKDNFDVFQKDGCANIVTSCDLAISTYLREKLKELLPGSSFFDEENGEEKVAEYEWIVDPIDGTMNFSRRLNQFVISVALKYQNEIVLGVVYSPSTDEVFYATKDGAFLNGIPIHVSNKSFEDSLFCTAMSLYDKSKAKVCSDIIYDTYMQCNDIRRFGSCALELCYLACGKCDLYFEIRVFPWDFAAAAFILKVAGGTIYSYNCSPLLYGKDPEILIGANSVENHKKLNEIVNKYIKR